MQIKKRLTFTITLVNSEAEKIKEFKDWRPNLTHRVVYLRGVEGIETDEKVIEDLKQEARNLVR